MNEKIVVDINGTQHKSTRRDISKKIYKEICPIAENEIFAKQDGKNHYVLVSSNGELFNPLEKNHDRSKKDRERGCLLFNLSKCNKKCYEYYLSFLKTKNRVSLTIAQRSYLYETGI